LGCGGVAVASFCFDGRAALVWLDPLEPERGLGAGVLCARHADGLTPPRGWHLQDRRVRAPRLWDDRPAGEPAARPSGKPAARPTGHSVREEAVVAPTESLPFGPVAAAETEPDGDVDDLLSARTPLLVRAFAAVRER
jgi:hypothetical protein